MMDGVMMISLKHQKFWWLDAAFVNPFASLTLQIKDFKPEEMPTWDPKVWISVTFLFLFSP